MPLLVLKRIFQCKNVKQKFIKYMLLSIIFAIIYCFIPSNEFIIPEWNFEINNENLKKKAEDKELEFLHLFINRLYYSFAIITTVGFGDMHPGSLRAMGITMLQFLCVIYLAIED